MDRRSDDMGSFRDWSEIPSHLLANVLDRLIVAEDYVKFGAVCVSWRTVFAQELGRWMNKRKHLLPFLLIPPYEEEEERKSRSLYNLSKQKVCDFKVQWPHNKWCRGSCFGWLVNFELDDSNHYSVQLHNPFLSSNHTIDLPSLDILTVNFRHHPIPNKYRCQSLCLQKAVLSANPTLADDYVVMAIIYCVGRLAFFRPGNKDWIPIDCKQLGEFEDIIYFYNTQQFYALNHLSAVFAIDLQLQAGGGGTEGSSDHPIPKLTQVAPQNIRGCNKKYLVESLSGDLLQVYKFLGITNSGEIVTKFEVFKFNVTTIGGEWIQIDSLGDAILFLGENSSFSLSASDIPGCKPNCIYFTEDNPSYRHNGEYYSPQYAAIFNLEDGTVHPHSPMESKKMFTLPVLIEPTIQTGNFQPYV